MKAPRPNFAREASFAKLLCGDLPEAVLDPLKELINRHKLSLVRGEVAYLNGSWYVTHSGLLRLAQRRHCAGIHVRPIVKFCDPTRSRWAFKAVVYKSRTCKGFAGVGDADPDNVGFIIRGAEMRAAETRAVNRALRKAYGIGICSIEEIGSLATLTQSQRQACKLPPQPANGNYGGPKVRDRLCQIIRQHQLDPNLVKSYAVDFCGTKTLREATREQVENFVAHLSDWVEKDRDALLCQLNSYLPAKGSAA